MKIVQCWDDGVSSDIRLVALLRKYNARASFNLNAGLHPAERTEGWVHCGNRVCRLALGELRSVYEGFTIANHTVSHPRLETLSGTEARREVREGRERLQDLFQQPVSGFAYPYGSYNEIAMAAVREAGHRYARTIRNVDHSFPPDDPMTLHPNCHFLAPNFWERYERARSGGIFYFWGHSFELIDEAMWSAFDATLARIAADPGAEWAELSELFPSA
ncbi:MAG TPA: polysaccharide deacetylase family protein [Kiritimatiellia bacterium]|nr:polysaccharide deacetylase family protein [Kiritimatiellia bacterium]